MKEIVIDFENGVISISSAFKKKAMVASTKEYRQLQEVRHDYPDFKQIVRQFKTNTKQDRYKGLTYEFMRDFIIKYESEETVQAVLAEFDKKIDISKCHSTGRRYPEVKTWFLGRYTDVYTFGKSTEEILLDAARAKAKKAADAIKAQDAMAAAEELEAIAKIADYDHKVIDLPTTGTEA